MRSHNVTDANGVPRFVRNTFAGERGVTSLGRPASMITVQRRHGFRPDRHDAFLVALADDVDETGFEMELFQAQAAKLGEAQAGGVGEFEHGLIAQTSTASPAVPAASSFSISALRQRFRQSFPAARQRKIFGDVHRQELFILGEAIEGPQRRDFEINAFAAESPRRFFRFVGQRALAFVLEERHEMFQLDLIPVGEFCLPRPGDELVQQAGVSFLRVLRLAAFVAEVLQEVFDEGVHGLVGFTVN